MRATGLEGHGKGLAGRVHDGVGHREADMIEARQDFEADADPCLRRCIRPDLSGCFRGGDERRHVACRVKHVEIEAPGRFLGTEALALRVARQVKPGADERPEGRFTVVLGGLTVDLAARNFRKG